MAFLEQTISVAYTHTHGLQQTMMIMSTIKDLRLYKWTYSTYIPCIMCLTCLENCQSVNPTDLLSWCCRQQVHLNETGIQQRATQWVTPIIKREIRLVCRGNGRSLQWSVKQMIVLPQNFGNDSSALSVNGFNVTDKTSHKTCISREKFIRG